MNRPRALGDSGEWQREADRRSFLLGRGTAKTLGALDKARRRALWLSFFLTIEHDPAEVWNPDDPNAEWRTQFDMGLLGIRPPDTEGEPQTHPDWEAQGTRYYNKKTIPGARYGGFDFWKRPSESGTRSDDARFVTRRLAFCAIQRWAARLREYPNVKRCS